MEQRRIIAENTPLYEDANEDLIEKPITECPETVDEMTAEEDKFIKFVNTQIERMEQHLLFNGNEIPTLDQLSAAICQHAHVMLALTSLYETSRWELSEAKENYDLWYAQHFMEIRNEVNREDMARAKWYSSSEIEMMLKSRYRKEIKALKAKMMSAEGKKSTLQHLIDGWNNYSFQLQTLSKNAMAEYQSVKRESYEDFGGMPPTPNMGY